MKDRALTAQQKRETVERLYAAWLGMPNQRLCQLLVNAVAARCPSPLFYVEDAIAVDAVEKYVQTASRNPR